MLLTKRYKRWRDIRYLNRNEDRTSEVRLRACEGRGRLAFWRRLTLWPRLALTVTLGFLVLFAVFSVLAVRGVDASTNRILQERLVLSELLAQEFDRLVAHALFELAAFEPGASSLSEQRRLLGRAQFLVIVERQHGQPERRASRRRSLRQLHR